MKRVFRSNLVGWDETATRAYLYELEEGDYEMLNDMTHDELCSFFNVIDESGCNIFPGAEYHIYHFELNAHFLVMYEVTALNV